MPGLQLNGLPSRDAAKAAASQIYPVNASPATVRVRSRTITEAARCHPPACRARIEGEGQMTSIELKRGNPVRLSELGASRSSKIRVRTGAVVALFSRKSRSESVGLLFDGNKRPTTLHRSYIERDDDNAKND